MGSFSETEGGKEALPESRQSFEVAAAQTSVLVNLVFSCQTGFFQYEHPFIDKPMVKTEPAVPGTYGTFTWARNYILLTCRACSTKILLDSSRVFLESTKSSERKKVKERPSLAG